MEGLKQYLMELPKEELLRKQLSDVLTMEAHAYAYSGKTSPTKDEIKEILYSVLKEQANITHELIYNPRDKTYLSSIGRDTSQWIEIEDNALCFKIDEVEGFKKMVLKQKILTRLEYKTEKQSEVFYA